MTESAHSAHSAHIDLSGPANEVVGAVWAEVLGEGTVDREVGFFDLGGSSMHVLQVVERLRVRWPGLRSVDLFLYPTVNSLAEFLEGKPAV
ncbi:phosphopantetheine-binding protein [Streptomyces sp. NPDC059917]|uniref:phosphopantetheine-binding protein n=1 Tax=Streptomyces sp. NPDC059917 TaxID=3347002 RepID=UPI00364E71D3